MYSNLFNVVIMLSPLISRMPIYIFLLLRIIIIFYYLFGKIHHISGKFYLLGWPQSLGFFTSLTKPILYLCHQKGFHFVIYLDNILVLVNFKQADKRAHSFLYSLLICLDLHINFSKSNLHLIQTFCFLVFCWDTVHMSVSLPSDELVDIQQLALSLLWTQPVAVHWVMSFLGRANILCQWTLTTAAIVLCHSE